MSESAAPAITRKLGNDFAITRGGSIRPLQKRTIKLIRREYFGQRDHSLDGRHWFVTCQCRRSGQRYSEYPSKNGCQTTFHYSSESPVRCPAVPQSVVRGSSARTEFNLLCFVSSIHAIRLPTQTAREDGPPVQYLSVLNTIAQRPATIQIRIAETFAYSCPTNWPLVPHTRHGMSPLRRSSSMGQELEPAFPPRKGRPLQRPHGRVATHDHCVAA